MKKQISLNVQTPCTENFNQFSPTEKGGFCNSCQTEVIDFTKMDSEEINNYFKTNPSQNTCGRFYSSQLNSVYNETHQKRKELSIFGGIGLACLSLFSIGTIQAQDIKNNKASNVDTAEVQDLNSIVVKGTIVDENGTPLPGANVILEGSTIGTTTDFDGNFTFPSKLKKGDVLVISYVGYDSKKVVVNNVDSATNVEMQIDMAMDVILMGKVASKQVYKSKRK